MPYIKKKDRPKYDELIHKLSQVINSFENQKGDLNYCITILIKEFMWNKGKCYNTLSDITGVLNDVKVEFERKVVGPYEDKKIEENGGIYEGLV